MIGDQQLTRTYKPYNIREERGEKKEPHNEYFWPTEYESLWGQQAADHKPAHNPIL